MAGGLAISVIGLLLAVAVVTVVLLRHVQPTHENVPEQVPV